MKNICKYLFMLPLLWLAACSDGENTPSVEVEEGFSEVRRIELPVNLSDRIETGEITLNFIHKKSNVPFSMKIEHQVENDKSVFLLNNYLRQGDYLLVSTQRTNEDGVVVENPLGCSVDLTTSRASVYPLNYTALVGCFGSGTAEDPFRISAARGLLILAQAMKDGYSLEGKYIQQQCDIDMTKYYNKGLDPIAHDRYNPFKGIYDGNGYAIKNYAVRYVDKTGVTTGSELAAGLFGYVCGATFRNVTMLNPQIYGGTSTGAIVGAALGKEGVDQTPTYFYNCRVKRTNSVAEVHGTNFVGGLVGGADMQATVIMKNCVNENLPVGNHTEGSFVGGLFGGGTLNAVAVLDSCVNYAPVTAYGSRCSGGIVGGIETAYITNCVNDGVVKAENCLGTGGIAGGLGTSILSVVINKGEVSGQEGTGGIVGSTIINKNEGIYNDVTMSSVHNYGTVNGKNRTGGLVGEAQALITDGYNRGAVRGTGSYTGGLCGFMPVVSLNSCYNNGNVDAHHYGGGIVGRSDFYVLANSSNVASVSADRTAAGIIAWGGSTGMVNFCNNYGSISSGNKAGGIVGSVGTRDDVSLVDAASCAVSGGIFGYTIISYVANFGQAVAPKGFIAKAMDGWHVISFLMDAGKMIKAIATPPILMDIDQWESLYSQEISMGNEQMRRMMLDEVRIKIPVADGVVPGSGQLPMLMYNNTEKFYTAMAQDGCEDYTTAVHKRLADINQDVAEVQRAREIGVTIAGCVLAAGTLASGFVSGGATLGLATATLEVVLSLATEGTENNSNAIEISQCCNFGTVSAGSNGYGIAARLGDFVRLRQCLSGGVASGHGIADKQNSNQVSVHSTLSFGTADQKPFGSSRDVKSANYYLVSKKTEVESEELLVSEMKRKDQFNFSWMNYQFDFDKNRIWSYEGQNPVVAPLPYNNLYYHFQ